MAKAPRTRNKGSEKISKELVTYEPERIVAAPAHLFAVYDDGENDYEMFPVVLFAIGRAVLYTGEETEELRSVLRGLVSSLGGLVVAEDAPDMKFVGYWRKDGQDFRAFLEDHELYQPEGAEDEDNEYEEYEDESELNR